MVLNYLPPVTHVIALTTIRRERRLPVPGIVTAEANARVQAQDVVAEAELRGRHLFVDVARELGVPANHVVRYLTRDMGERVEAGDVLAGPVGWARRSVRAPFAGRVVHHADGRLLIETRGKQVEVRAGFPGVVVGTDGFRSVTIETTGALVQGVWGNGREDIGVLSLVGEGPGFRLASDALDINVRGGVLVAGFCDHAAPLQRANELAVRGMILGGLSAELVPVVRRLRYPLIVLEGFGDLPLDGYSYRLLQSMEGKQAAVDGRPAQPFTFQRPEAIIPLPHDREVDLSDEVLPLAPGTRVRVLRSPHQGCVGLVQDLHRRAVGYPSGIIARSARVDLEGVGPKDVPLVNLEILQ